MNGDVIQQGNEIVLSGAQEIRFVQLGGLTFRDPKEMIAQASEMSTALAQIVEDKHLYVMISNKKHVQVEGWTTLGAMLGIVPQEESCKIREDKSYVATVKLVRLRDGSIVGRASAECGREEVWATRPSYARRSMAITRATGKAFRLGYSWIMVLAGYEPTPAEEMGEQHNHMPVKQPQRASVKTQAATAQAAAQQKASESKATSLQAVVEDVKVVRKEGKKPVAFVKLAGQKDAFSCFDEAQFENLEKVKGRTIGVDFKESKAGDKTYKNVLDWWLINTAREAEQTNQGPPDEEPPF